MIGQHVIEGKPWEKHDWIRTLRFAAFGPLIWVRRLSYGPQVGKPNQVDPTGGLNRWTQPVDPTQPVIIRYHYRPDGFCLPKNVFLFLQPEIYFSKLVLINLVWVLS